MDLKLLNELIYEIKLSIISFWKQCVDQVFISNMTDFQLINFPNQFINILLTKSISPFHFLYKCVYVFSIQTTIIFLVDVVKKRSYLLFNFFL